jgi:uncharacterized phage protein (TIGR02218 family)
MLPSAIRRTADLAADSADVEGALSHEAISSADLAAGLFDGAQVRLGVVDWETGDRAVLYRGEIGAIGQEASGFTAELLSAKAELEIDPVPRTSPTCRARFCGPGCTLSAARYTHELRVATVDLAANAVAFEADRPPNPSAMACCAGSTGRTPAGPTRLSMSRTTRCCSSKRSTQRSPRGRWRA